MSNRIELGEGFFYPDEKKYCFMKRSAADVDVNDESGSNYFTYTPGFGDFKDIDLEEYLVKYVKDNKLSWCEEFLESSGCECDSWEWNPKTQEFDDYEYEDDDEEEEE